MQAAAACAAVAGVAAAPRALGVRWVGSQQPEGKRVPPASVAQGVPPQPQLRMLQPPALVSLLGCEPEPKRVALGRLASAPENPEAPQAPSAQRGLEERPVGLAPAREREPMDRAGELRLQQGEQPVSQSSAQQLPHPDRSGAERSSSAPGGELLP